MTISSDLFLAILSMDAYNRGYGAGIGDGRNVDANGVDIDGLGVAGAQIGTAQVKDVDLPDGSQAAGFYAAAYTVGAGVDGLAAGTTVISYRGTDGNPRLRHSGAGRRPEPGIHAVTGEKECSRQRFSRLFRHGFRVPRHGAAPE